jgi:2'-5' RNA ligase
LSPFPARMEDHWLPRPGTDPGRARLMWFIRAGHCPQVAELAQLGQERLAGLDGLDLVPRQWLHITTLIAGYADQITPDQVGVMAGQARRLLAGTPPVTITLSRIWYHPRAVMLGVGPPGALDPVLRAAQQATRTATGHDGELHTQPWTPHITLAYSNTARAAGPVIDALGHELPTRQAAVTAISLVSQAPEQLWTWDLVTDVPLGTGQPHQTHGVTRQSLRTRGHSPSIRPGP